MGLCKRAIQKIKVPSLVDFVGSADCPGFNSCASLEELNFTPNGRLLEI
jgi:hypothetical protein